MLNQFKYLTHNKEDIRWGMYMTVAGSAKIEPENEYPPSGHPSGYHFNWSNGRVLQEYQVNYITEGEGIMETREGNYPIKEGSIILLHPNMWHRYRPLKRTGWMEHYVGFMGNIAEHMIRSSLLLSKMGVLQIGYQEDIMRNFQEIVNHVKAEKPGFHQICSGLVINILGHIISVKKNENFRHSQIENAIQKEKNINVEQLAGDLNINYSLFRKAFKRYTGLSPIQYHTSLRLKQAMFLLTNTNLSVKEISFSQGFCTVFYFSKLFKEKTGKTPTDYRKETRNDQTG